jgi:hypothetical protein
MDRHLLRLLLSLYHILLRNWSILRLTLWIMLLSLLLVDNLCLWMHHLSSSDRARLRIWCDLLWFTSTIRLLITSFDSSRRSLQRSFLRHLLSLNCLRRCSWYLDFIATSLNLRCGIILRLLLLICTLIILSAHFN